MYKFILIACFLILTSSVKSERPKSCRIKNGSINYFISNRASKTFYSCHYYFEDFGNTGFIKLKRNDSSITNFVIYNKRLYQYENDSILSKDTFFGLINVFFKLNGINIRYRIEDSIHTFGLKFIKINKLRVYIIHHKWALTRYIDGRSYINYKGLVLGIGDIVKYNDLFKLETNFAIISKRKENKYRKIKKLSLELNNLLSKLHLLKP